MRNKRGREVFLLLVILLLGILVIGKYASSINPVFGQQNIVPPPPTHLPPNMPANGNTATPTFNAPLRTILARTVWPTPTILGISKVTDLSPELATGNKYIVVVAHPNGTNEEFIIGPLATSGNIYKVPQDIIAKLNLSSGDKVLYTGLLRDEMIGGPQPTASNTPPLSPTQKPTLPPSETPPPYPGAPTDSPNP